jgi:hypothetical protein
MLVTLAALITQLEPIQVTTKYGALINSLLTLLMNSSPAITLMWFFERLYLAIRGITRRIQTTATASTNLEVN